MGGGLFICATMLVATVTVSLTVEEQFPLDTVTEYPWVALGVTVIVGVVAPPGFHKYVVPPLAANGIEVPLHIVELGLMDGVGLGITVIVTSAESLHVPPEMTTEYVVVTKGITVMEEVLCPPGLHE